MSNLSIDPSQLSFPTVIFHSGVGYSDSATNPSIDTAIFESQQLDLESPQTSIVENDAFAFASNDEKVFDFRSSMAQDRMSKTSTESVKTNSAVKVVSDRKTMLVYSVTSIEEENFADQRAISSAGSLEPLQFDNGSAFAGTSVTQNNYADSSGVSPELYSFRQVNDSVDTNSSADIGLGQPVEDKRTKAAGEVNDLLRELHTPSSRSIEYAVASLPAQPGAQGTIMEHVNPEGGMILLKSAQHVDRSELYLVDQAFAEFPGLFNVDVKIEPTSGAYQAFDVGSLGHDVSYKANHAATRSLSDADRSERDMSSSLAPGNTEGNAQTVAAILATAAGVVSFKVGSRSQRKRRSQQLNSLFS